MDTISPEKRAILALKRMLTILVARVRRVLGSLFQIVLNDQLGDLSRQTKRLGSASVESVTYVGGELRAMDERLSRIEQELAALRELLERSGPSSAESLAEARDDVVSGPRSG